MFRRKKPSTCENSNLEADLSHDKSGSQGVFARSEIADLLSTINAKLDELISDVEMLRKRNSIYIGDGVALTYLSDDTPIYVNAYDFGSPANFINGGVYERDNLDVILSFVRDDTVFLDIGANLGFFSLEVARRVRPFGQVHAFEPNPRLLKLLRASAYLNGFSDLTNGRGVICSHAFGLGESEAIAEFEFPENHLGGATKILADNGSTSKNRFTALVRPLDDVFGDQFTCDIVKIDVEGQETQVLRGMKGLLVRSPSIVVIFEKLQVNVGDEAIVAEIFDAAGLEMYAIESGASLRKLTLDMLVKYSGYVLAVKSRENLDESKRTTFRIYSRQLWTRDDTLVSIGRDEIHSVGLTGQILFHGPYWELRRGVYRCRVKGVVRGQIDLCLCSKFGRAVKSALVQGVDQEVTFVIERDLTYFECVARVKSEKADVKIEYIEFRSIG